MELRANELNKSVLQKLKEWKNSPLLFVSDCIRAVPSEQQVELLIAVGKNKRVTVRSGHGCHAKGTIIHMYPYGFRCVEDIQVGDYVMGDDGTPREVLTLNTGEEEMARIQYHNGTYYDVNMSHELALVHSKSRYELTSEAIVVVSVRDYLAAITDRPFLKERFAGCKVSDKKTLVPYAFDVIPLPKAKYYGFSVDKNHLYVLGDFTVTHNCGKDATVAWIILWFMITRSYAKVACTAPTNRQLYDVLRSEISKWLRQSTVADEFLIRKDAILHKEAPREWWVRFISPSVRATKDEQAETLAGLHAAHLLLIVDEASGVPDPVYIPLEGALTQPDNKVILIGNMTKGQGYFFDTHFHSEISKDWCRLHWDSRKSSRVDPSMPLYFERKYGIDSNIYRIRVAGDPPLQDESTLIPLWAAEQCIGQEFGEDESQPLYLGVDVARYGDDASIIMPRRGYIIHPWEEFRKLNTISLGGFINQTFQEQEADGCAIDVIGVGAGVADWLEKKRMPNLHQVNVTHESSNISQYHRLRDELWCRVRDNCLATKYAFPDIKPVGEQESLGRLLANELASVRYDFNSDGGIVVESKKKRKSRGLSSPNIADALCLTEYFYHPATRPYTKEKPLPEDSVVEFARRYRNTSMERNGWLAR